MLDDLRGPGPIVCDEGLRKSLSRLRAAAGVTGPADLLIDEVRAVEAGVRTRFEDDLLAVFASAVPLLSERHEMALSRVIPLSGVIGERKVRGDLVGVGRLDPARILCVEPRARRGEPSDVKVFDLDRKTLSPFDLRAWLEELVRAAAPCPAPSGGDFAPRVIANMTQSYREGRRVRHKTFGEGRALAETGTGADRKVKAEFPGVGLKVVLARFLEYLD